MNKISPNTLTMPKYDLRVRKPSATEDEYYIRTQFRPSRKQASSAKQLNDTIQRNDAAQSGNGPRAKEIQPKVGGEMVVRSSQKETVKDLENSEVSQVNKTSSEIIETDDSKILKVARASLKKQLSMNEGENELARETDSALLNRESKITDIFPAQIGSKSSILAIEDVSKEVLQDDASTDLPPDESSSSKNTKSKKRKVAADTSDTGTKATQPEKVCSRKNAIATKKATNARNITPPEVLQYGIMRYNEKRKLAQNIKRLPAKMIVDLIEIIEKFENTSYDTIGARSDYFEINLDNLRDITLLTIEAFVNSTLGLNTRTNRSLLYSPQKMNSPPKTIPNVVPLQPLADLFPNSQKAKQSRDFNQTLPNQPSAPFSATILEKKNTPIPSEMPLSQKTQSPPKMISKEAPLQPVLLTSSQKTKQSRDLNETLPNVQPSSYSATMSIKKHAKFHTDNDNPKSSGISLSQKIESTPKVTLPQPSEVTLTKSRKTKQSGNLNQTLPNVPSAYSTKLSEPKMTKTYSTQSFQVESYDPRQFLQRTKSPSNANKTLPMKRTILGVKQPQSSLRNGTNNRPESYATNKTASPTLEQKESIRKLREEDQERRRQAFASITSLSQQMELMDWMDAQL